MFRWMEKDAEDDNPVGDGNQSFTQRLRLNASQGNESLETGVRRNWFVDLLF